MLSLIVKTFLGELIITFIGYTILRHSSKGLLPIPHLIALSFGLGWGFLSLLMFLAILLGVNAKISAIPVLVGTTAFFFLNPRNRKSLAQDLRRIRPFFKSLKFNLTEKFCVGLVSLEFCCILLEGMSVPYHAWDAVAMWEGKAVFIFHDGTIDSIASFPHPSYPLNTTLELVFFFSLYGTPHHYAKMLFASFFLSLVIVFYYTLREGGLGKTTAILVTSILSLNTLLYDHATIAYADLPLTFYYTTAFIFIFQFFRTGAREKLVLAAIFHGLAAWTKIEGYGLLAVNFLVLTSQQVVSVARKKDEVKQSVVVLLEFGIISLVIFTPWMVTTLVLEMEPEYISGIPLLFDFETVGVRIGRVFQAIPLLHWSTWLGFLYFTPVVVWFAGNFRKTPYFLALVMFLGHLLLTGLVYLITPLSIELHVLTSLDRELMHALPSWAFLAGVLVSEDQRSHPGTGQIWITD